MCGGKPIAMQTHWLNEERLCRRGKFSMILAPDFCGNAFIGIQWVLYHPGGLRVNASLHFCTLCFVLLVVGLVVWF